MEKKLIKKLKKAGFEPSAYNLGLSCAFYISLYISPEILETDKPEKFIVKKLKENQKKMNEEINKKIKYLTL